MDEQNGKNNRRHGWGWITSYLRIGLIGFGGGSALIPVIEQEVVGRTGLISKEDYDRDVLVASVTPGALPVGISGGNGKRIAGLPGMCAAAVAMALPGALIAVILLAFLSASSGMILEQIRFIAIGVTGFILALLTGYVSSTLGRARKIGKLRLCIGIILIVLVLNCGSSLFKLLAAFGVDGSALLSISTVDILMVLFFVLLYTHGHLKLSRVIPCAIIVIPYLFCVSNASPIEDDSLIVRALQLIMVCLAVYSVIVHRSGGTSLNRIPWSSLLREEGVWLLFLIVFSIPAVIVFGDYFAYLIRGLFSSVISFGGGDAYITVADSLFVSSGDSAASITSDDFYSKVVTIVNVVPGSILCKTLSSIGYLLGFNASGMVGGCLVALGGFAISIVGTCAVVTLAHYLLNKFENLYEFELIKRWTRAIISGLLGSVIFSLIATSLGVAATYDVSVIAIAIELAAFYAFNLILSHFTNIGGGMQVLLCIVLSFIVGNFILML